jgi:hypothetical protein
MSTKTDTEASKGQSASHTRPTGKRPVPFLASALVAFGLLPVLFLVSRLVMLWDQATGLMVAHAWFVSGLTVALIAIGIGLFHAKRTNFLIKHVAVTVILIGVGGDLYTLAGFRHRFMNVVAVFMTGILYSSWMLYRIDAFRAAAKGESGDDGWGKVIGLAKSRPKKITTTPSQVIIDVEHGPGETIKNVRTAAGELEDKTGAIVGRTTVTPNERGGGSQVALTMADPFDEWRKFPGLSHPGGSFAFPFRTSYYATGEDQWFGFVATQLASPVTDFVAPQATFLGLVGTTGVGKSGEENNVAAEGLSRCDAIVCWVDAEKLYQNAGWALDMLGMAAKDRNQAKRLSVALRKLAEYRVELFGQASLDAALDPGNAGIVAGREWTPQLAQETGEAAVLVIMDEADTFLSKGQWDWLGKRGRSLGIFLVCSVPRASTQEVPAAFRGSIAAWKTFAIGDKYSGEFTLSQIARDGGADPESLRIRGAHYFDLVPGVPERLWPVLCRSFFSDTRDLRRMVKEARATFTPMTFTDEAIRWMGEDYQACTPAAVLALRGPRSEDEKEGDPAEPAPDGQATQRNPLAPAAGSGEYDDDDDDEEGVSVDRTMEGSDPDEQGGEGVVATLLHPGLAEDAAKVDPRDPGRPLKLNPGERMSLPDDKPEPPNEEQAEADLDSALTRLADDGQMEFSNSDLQKRMRYAMQPYTVSRRLAALAEGARLTPPGLQLERLGAGRYLLIRTGPLPRRPKPSQEGE